MTRRRTKRVRQPVVDYGVDAMHYFFEGGDVRRPSQKLVTREELFNVLEWYTLKVTNQRTLKARLWRILRRWPSSMLNPFALVRLRRSALEAGEDPGE